MAKTEMTKSPETTPSRPRDVISAMHDEMDRVFQRFQHGWPRWPTLLYGRDGDITDARSRRARERQWASLEVELPGVDEKDVSVTFNNGYLTIKGEKKAEREEKKDNYYLAERSFGSFERSLRLPDTLDDSKIEAKFGKGVLTVTAPKRPEALKAERTIEIKKA